jgi:hypothetical protein
MGWELGLVVRWKNEAFVPSFLLSLSEVVGVGVKVTEGRKAVFGIQYCGKKRCSQTSLASVVSKM